MMPYTVATELLAKELNIDVDLTLLRLLEKEIEEIQETENKSLGGI